MKTFFRYVNKNNVTKQENISFKCIFPPKKTTKFVNYLQSFRIWPHLYAIYYRLGIEECAEMLSNPLIFYSIFFLSTFQLLIYSRAVEIALNFRRTLILSNEMKKSFCMHFGFHFVDFLFLFYFFAVSRKETISLFYLRIECLFHILMVHFSFISMRQNKKFSFFQVLYISIETYNKSVNI